MTTTAHNAMRISAQSARTNFTGIVLLLLVQTEAAVLYFTSSRTTNAHLARSDVPLVIRPLAIVHLVNRASIIQARVAYGRTRLAPTAGSGLILIVRIVLRPAPSVKTHLEDADRAYQVST